MFFNVVEDLLFRESGVIFIMTASPYCFDVPAALLSYRCGLSACGLNLLHVIFVANAGIALPGLFQVFVQLNNLLLAAD